METRFIFSLIFAFPILVLATTSKFHNGWISFMNNEIKNNEWNQYIMNQIE
jgi:hypothetical protein